eukprot:scaffold5759_cov82-Skeletonema_dohrnii-CCMP3373.AAC.1
MKCPSFGEVRAVVFFELREGVSRPTAHAQRAMFINILPMTLPLKLTRRIACARIACGRIACGRIACGRIACGRTASGRTACGRIASGRIAYG